MQGKVYGVSAIISYMYISDLTQTSRSPASEDDFKLLQSVEEIEAQSGKF